MSIMFANSLLFCVTVYTQFAKNHKPLQPNFPVLPRGNMSETQQDAAKEQNKVKAKATGDLDKVTDYVEEREIDATKVADSMRAVLGSASASKKLGKDHEFMHVKIQQSDVQLIIDELDMDPKKAEQALRRAGGDVVQALCQLVR